MLGRLLVRESFETGCTVEVEQSHDHFHAHVRLDGDLAVGPGDRVRVHGAPIQIAFGASLVERRTATVDRAGWLRRAWTRASAHFELADLAEVSFSPGRMR